MKATGICVILLSQGGFKSDCPGKMKNEITRKLFHFFLFSGIRNLESRKKIVEIEFYLFIYLFIFVLRHYILGKKVRKSKNKKKLNRINLQNLKWSSDRLAIIAKRFLKLPNLHMLIKQESMTSQKLGSLDFWRIANSVLHKDKSAIPPLFSIQRSGAVVFCIWWSKFVC